MNKYGQYRYEDKEVVKKKVSVWQKDFMKDSFNHTKKLRAIYNMPTERHLINKIVREIVNGPFKKCQIKQQISKLKYHRLNRGSVGQEEDDFEIIKKSKAKQVTLIITFTKVGCYD